MLPHVTPAAWFPGDLTRRCLLLLCAIVLSCGMWSTTDVAQSSMVRFGWHDRGTMCMCACILVCQLFGHDGVHMQLYDSYCSPGCSLHGKATICGCGAV